MVTVDHWRPIEYRVPSLLKGVSMIVRDSCNFNQSQAANVFYTHLRRRRQHTHIHTLHSAISYWTIYCIYILCLGNVLPGSALDCLLLLNLLGVWGPLPYGLHSGGGHPWTYQWGPTIRRSWGA